METSQTSMRLGPFNGVPQTSQFKEIKQAIANRAGDWKSEHPGPNQPRHHTPSDGVEAFRRPDAHDGRRNHVSGREWNTEKTCGLDHDSAGGLGCKTVNRLQAGQTLCPRLFNEVFPRGKFPNG